MTTKITFANFSHEREVVVEIPHEVVAYVERITRRELPAENSFWTHRAERTLATHDEVEVAARWQEEKPLANAKSE